LYLLVIRQNVSNERTILITVPGASK